MTQEDKNDATAHTVRLLAGGATTNDDEPEARIRIATRLANIDGKKINDTLIPYKMVIVPVQLNEKELEINESVMAQITGFSMAAALDDMPNFNTKFYLDGRTKVVFPHHQSPTYPVVKSLAEWDMVRSTKVDMLIKLLAWHLQSDEHDTFNIDEESAKGDQCWSRMLVNQIIGRAWRLGQQKEVIVYNMVALGTVDVLMLHHGEGKGNMLKQFLTANKVGLAGHEPIHDDDDDEVEFIDPPAPTPGPSKSHKKAMKGGKKRVTRNIAQTGDEDGDILDLDNMVLTDADGHEDEGDNGETGKGKGKAKAKGKGKASAKPKPKPKPKVKGKGKGKATVEDDESEGDVVVVECDDQNKAHKWFIELTPLANRPAAGQTAETTSGPLMETAVGDTASSTMDTAGLTGEGDGSQKEGGSSSAAASSGGPPGEPDEQSATATPPAPSVSDAQSLVVASNASHTDGPRGELPSLAASGQAAPHTEHPAGANPPSGTATNTLDIGPSSIQKGKSAETSIPDNNDMDVDLGTMETATDKAAVDKMLADLTQSESNISNHPSSDCPSTPTPDAQVVQTSQPTQDLGTAAKRRRTPSSSTATPSAPPYAPSPPHKHVHVRSSNLSSPIGSPDQTTTGGAAMRNRSAVPHDAPGPRGHGRSSRGVSSRAGRGRGGRR
ncbi:hypothetical protein BDR07DRAFT_1493392 [Suillus spraguei]|nr:hypothetical protein BDR07DRAFT_1493392 [Suillus spraguei]